MTEKPNGWMSKNALHQPEYPNLDELKQVTEQLAALPPLVFADEVDMLRADLVNVENGNGFLLQGGDCAESFAEFSEANITDTVRVILQMAVTLTYAGGCPVVKMGRIAGQFAKPRSSPTEQRDGITLPSYLGDSVNAIEFSEQGRIPDPDRLIRAYHQAVSTMNLLRAMAKGGFSSLRNVREWNVEAVHQTALADKYGEMTDRIHQALDFMEACGLPLEAFASLQGAALYTSHEALLLDYEHAMMRNDNDRWYDLSSHCQWIGERTRQLDGAHVEFLSQVANPVGVKVGPSATPEDCLGLLDRLNPDKEPGKVIFVSRMGADHVAEKLPVLLDAVRDSAHSVIWVCDPMHGNTATASNGLKTRNFDRIIAEISAFFAAHRNEGTWPGGLHLEMTGRYVTECTGGAYSLADDDLHRVYDTQCDPRLNAGQALEIAYHVADQLRGF